MMQSIHLRMARAALGWTLKALAEKAGVNLNTVARYEAEKEVLSGTIKRIEEVLIREGVVFIDEREGGPGIIIRRQPVQVRKSTEVITSKRGQYLEQHDLDMVAEDASVLPPPEHTGHGRRRRKRALTQTKPT